MLRVTDSAFSLHIHEAGIASAWLVRGLNRTGIGRHLELHDERGGLALCLWMHAGAGARAERRWRRLLNSLERVNDTVRICRDVAVPRH